MVDNNLNHTFLNFFAWELVQRLWRVMRRYRHFLVGGIFCMVIFSMITLIPPILIKDIIDAIEAGKTPELNGFLLVSGGLILLFVFKGLAYYGQNFLMNALGQKLVFALRNRLFKKIVNLPLSFFDKQPTGDLISRFTIDLSYIEQSIRVAVVGPLRDFPLVIGLLVIMGYRSWQLFLVTLCMLPVAVFLIGKFGLQNRKVTTERQNQFGRMTTLLTETITGIRIVKAFSVENYEMGRFEQQNQNLLRCFIRSVRINSYSLPILELTGAVCLAVILYYGGYLIIEGVITTGDFVSYLFAFLMLNEPIKKLNGFTLKFQEGLVAARRIFEVLDSENPLQNDNITQKLPKLHKGHTGIKIDIQSFGYKLNQPVLHDIHLEIKADQAIALVGASGSGKTTLVNLIPRFYDIPKSEGGIYINGHDIREVQLQSLRQQIAIVTQETILFDDTVLNNISYGNIDCPFKKVVDAAVSANAYGFIQQLPFQFEQPIGEKGVVLSGGQKQRLAIARALVKDAPILILDEATSSLDSESEKEVQAAIENLMKNRTTLVIAHRLSTIQNVDLIYVLKHGRIVEVGHHNDLLRLGGEYKNLYSLQFENSISKLPKNSAKRFIS